MRGDCFREENLDLLSVDYWEDVQQKAASRRGAGVADVSGWLQARRERPQRTRLGADGRLGVAGVTRLPRGRERQLEDESRAGPAPSLSARKVPPSS